jgi:hypothetical protein
MKILKKHNKKKNNRKVSLSAGNLYDINKNLVKDNVSPLTKEEIADKRQLILNFLTEMYYMLLCNDRKDYTVFRITESKEECVNILIDECLKNRGEILSIEPTENKDAFEIWMKIENEAFCYYFFPYSQAIIEC